MDAIHGVRLRIVSRDRVLPHEIADPRRERRLEEQLRAEGILSDPLIVGAVAGIEGYVLLDGTNRKEALGRLEYPLALVQVLDYADHIGIELWTWCHSVELPVADLLSAAEQIPAVRVARLSPLAAPDALASHSTLAVLLSEGQAHALIRTNPVDETLPRQLRSLVHLYEEYLERVHCNHADIEDHAREVMAAGSGRRVLVAFPPLTRSQVVGMAMNGELIPAGITRHVIHSGRAVRVNLPLEVLHAADEEAGQALLNEHVASLHPRLYQEPTILFDS